MIFLFIFCVSIAEEDLFVLSYEVWFPLDGVVFIEDRVDRVGRARPKWSLANSTTLYTVSVTLRAVLL